MNARQTESELDFEDPHTTMELLGELVICFKMTNLQFQQLHHAKKYLNTIAGHYSYCQNGPKRFQQESTNSYTARRLHYCLRRLRAKASWTKAIADAVARFPR